MAEIVAWTRANERARREYYEHPFVGNKITCMAPRCRRRTEHRSGICDPCRKAGWS